MANVHVERRLAAILAADVVGYSSLMERDEDRTLARLKAHRQEFIEPLIAKYQGRIVKLMGDGTLVEFASVVDAVRCAVAIQLGMAEREAKVAEAERIRLRIGINLGDVIHETDGDLYGDGVNVAARLEQLATPGGVVVSGTAYDQLHGKLDLALDFAGEQRVKNIERLVRIYRVRMDGTVARARRPFRWTRRLTVPVVMALLLVLAAGGASWLWPEGPSGSGKPSIAVLPLANLGGDEATGRLADGLTEDTITDLARFRGLDVIARNSTEVYRGKAIDIRQVGRDLNVGYLLEGSVQRQGDQVRVTAQLIDTRSGAQVWSEQWDRPAADVFAVQTELAETVADKIGGYYSGILVNAGQEAAKQKRPQDLSAYDLYLLGMEAKHRGTREGIEEGIGLLKRSLAIDPSFARAWTGLFWASYALSGYVEETPEVEKARKDAARRAVELDPENAEARVALATIYADAGDLGHAEAEFDKALRLSPNSADLLAIYADWASSFGKPDAGVAAVERSMRLNPNIPQWAFSNFRHAYFMAGRYGDALRMQDHVPKEAYLRHDFVYRAATLAALGRMDEARAAVAETLARFPQVTVEWGAWWYGLAPLDYRRLDETMRKAGFPVCASAEDVKSRPDFKPLPECDAERAKAANRS